MPGGMPRTRTTRPIVTGTSIIAVKFAGGVAMISDTLGSYGGLARFFTEERLKRASFARCVSVCVTALPGAHNPPPPPLPTPRSIRSAFGVHKSVLIGFGGDMSDSQAIERMIQRETVRDRCWDDGRVMTSREIYSLLSRIMCVARVDLCPRCDRSRWQSRLISASPPSALAFVTIRRVSHPRSRDFPPPAIPPRCAVLAGTSAAQKTILFGTSC